MREITILEIDEKVKFYNIKETANLLNVSVATINRWLKANKINCTRFGKSVCFAEEEIVRLQQLCLRGFNILKK